MSRPVKRQVILLDRPELASQGFWRSLTRCTPGGAPCSRCGLPFAQADRILRRLPLEKTNPICEVEGCRPSRVFRPHRKVGGREVERTVEREMPALVLDGVTWLSRSYDKARAIRAWIFDYQGERA